MTPMQNVIKCLTQNVIAFLTHTVITQNVIQVGTRSQSTKSEVYSINAHGMGIQVYSSRLLVGIDWGSRGEGHH